jgi:hypothetical protein
MLKIHTEVSRVATNKKDLPKLKSLFWCNLSIYLEPYWIKQS